MQGLKTNLAGALDGLKQSGRAVRILTPTVTSHRLGLCPPTWAEAALTVEDRNSSAQLYEALSRMSPGERAAVKAAMDAMTMSAATSSLAL